MEHVALHWVNPADVATLSTVACQNLRMMSGVWSPSFASLRKGI